MLPEGWAALCMCVPMPPLKRFNRFNKCRNKFSYVDLYVHQIWALPPATMVAETAPLVVSGGVGGPAQSFPPVFFFWREAKFFEALGRTKKQTDRELNKALFLTT